MKRFYCLPMAALVVACSDSTAPLSPASSDLQPTSSWTGATFGFEGSSTAAVGYTLSSTSLAVAPSGESFLGRFTNEIVTLRVPAGG